MGALFPLGWGSSASHQNVDYLLRYTRDFPLAVVEAKASYKTATDGLQQAKQYAEMLGLKFAYATNGHDIIEFDYTSGLESYRADFPTPAALWQRYRAHSGIDTEDQAKRLLTPFNHTGGKGERYYQQIAVNRTVERILKGDRRTLITLEARCWGIGRIAEAALAPAPSEFSKMRAFRTRGLGS
jgi:type I restriction enzyme R subunit